MINSSIPQFYLTDAGNNFWFNSVSLHDLNMVGFRISITKIPNIIWKTHINHKMLLLFTFDNRIVINYFCGSRGGSLQSDELPVSVALWVM